LSAAEVGDPRRGHFIGCRNQHSLPAERNPARSTPRAGFLHRRSPGAAAANRGFQAWVPCVEGDDPPPCDRITISPPTACLGHHCEMQNRQPKKRSPERGLISRGHAGSMNSGIMLGQVSQRDAWIKGTTLESSRGVILVPLLDGGGGSRRAHFL